MVLVEHRVAAVVPLVDRVVVLSPTGVVADGVPEKVFTEHGAVLAEQGVWVPEPWAAPVEAHRGWARQRAERSGAHGQAAPGNRHSPGGVLLSARAARMCVPGGRKAVFSDLDLDVCEGEALAVLGPNGAGKTTLALMLGGLLRPAAGSVAATARLAGADAARPPWAWRAAALAARIGSVFQSPEHQFVTSTVRDEVALGPRRLGRLGRQSRQSQQSRPASVADDLLDRLHLAHLAAANPFTLSGGEARRLSVATALAAAPALLILDEPTFGQDRRTWCELVDLLADLRAEGRGLVLATHDDLLVSALADRRFEL
jgi:energy-coupling factor transport system ATP-binding protein